MTNPYTTQSISGYNSNPPADDGSQVSSNEVSWDTEKTKLTDPIKTLAEAIDTQLVSAFLRVPFGAVVAKSADYTVLTTDRGTLFAVTGTTTLTLPAASSAGDGFTIGAVNAGSGTVTIDGNASETINGATTVTVAVKDGITLICDGTNWSAIGGVTAAQGRTNLGLGTIATQAASNVAITGGSITGITDVTVADGGTGASTAANARTNLGLGSIATQSASSVTITGGSVTGITDVTVADGGTGASTASGARTNLGLGALAVLGTINNSNWSGTDLAIANGGTGASTAVAALNALGIYAGYVDSAATAEVVPSGWSVSVTSSEYTITHNLGTTSYALGGMPETADLTVNRTAVDGNNVKISFPNLSSVNTATNFWFWLIKY